MHPPRSRHLVLCVLSALSAMHAMPAAAANKRITQANQATALLVAQPVTDVTGDPQDVRRALEQRVLEQPNDMRARLSLAQTLASRADTRRAGIVQLSQLAGDPVVGGEAIGSWRAALDAAAPEADDIPLYQAYLRMRPADTMVRSRLAVIQRGLPATASTSATAATAAAGSDAAPAPLAGTAYLPPVALPVTGTATGTETSAVGAAATPAVPAAGAPASIASADFVIPAPVLPPGQAATADGAAPRSFMSPAASSFGSRGTTAASAGDYPVGPRAAMVDESPAQAQLRGLQAEIADIQSQRGRPEFTAGLVVRSRSGEKGTSSLTDTEFPMQLRMDLGDGMLTANVTPVSLRTGGIDTSFSSISRFGGGPVVATAQPGVSAGGQNASGVGVGVGYEQGNLAVDIGTTPMGFQYTEMVGGVRYRMPVNEELSFSMNLSRRVVNDSVLSFAGARDARTGQEWGGVTANGARVDATYDRGDYGLYGYAGLAKLIGHNVQDNTRGEYGAGIYWRLIRQTDTTFTAGVALSGLAFDRNLGYYTFGQGGYFSPQQFVSLGVPVEWAQRSGRMSYVVRGSLGVQHLRQDPSNYFPTDAGQQAAAGTVYDGQSKTGLGYGLSGALEYQLEPQWFLGGRLGIDNSRDYRQYAGSLYVRYAFRPHEGPQVMPVNPVRSPYGS
ncbi:hypothetical protein GN316_08845 [Xylophilus sp. Kf1]|nr:hypothetical protein [Xylophilus sp. Kf1]